VFSHTLNTVEKSDPSQITPLFILTYPYSWSN